MVCGHVCYRLVLSVIFGCEVYFVPIRDSGSMEAALYCTHCETVYDEMNCSPCLTASMKDTSFFVTLKV